MDDKTRGLGREDMTGRSDEATRNLDPTSAGSAGRTQGTRATSTSRAARPAPASSRTGTTRSSSSRSDLDPATDRRTREIQAEISDTRDEMAETIDAIQDKLRPSNLMAEARDTIKSATTERVRHMAGSAGESAHDMMRGTRHRAAGMVEEARQNPIPALMIGVGVAWMLIEHARSGGESYGRARQPRRRPLTSGEYGRYYGSETAGVYDSEEVDYAYGSYESYEAEDRSSNRRGMRHTSARASERADEARRMMRQRSRQARSGLRRLLRENPLLVGAAAVVAGAAVGAALPETAREDELMGDTRDSMIEQAQEVARNIPNTVQQVAGEAVTRVAEQVTGGDDTSR